jgi:hypothetical protein
MSTNDVSKALDQRYETIAWGVLFIWAALTDLIPGLPYGTGMVGIGIILLGLNLARYFGKIQTNVYTVTFGLIAVLLGIAMYLLNAQGIRLKLPFFETVLMAIGVFFLIRGITRPRTG